MTDTIRDAATVIVSRSGAEGPEVLMGQRGAAAAFMPSKFVFPGGAVDPADAHLPRAFLPSGPNAARLAVAPGPTRPDPAAIAATAIRELWEETGLPLATPGIWPDPAPPGWEGFAAAGFCPTPAALRYVFRAITPPGRSRRFDARFFLVDAGNIAGDLDDFSRACDELSLLHWVPLTRARALDLPFITEIVLAEIAPLIGNDALPASVPFFDNSTDTPVFRRIP